MNLKIEVGNVREKYGTKSGIVVRQQLLRKTIRWGAIENGQNSQNDLKRSGRNAH